jgi:hypothetical protein
LEGLIDFAKERVRLEKWKADAAASLLRDEERLANPEFRQRAPAEKVAEIETRRTETKAQLARLDAFLRALEFNLVANRPVILNLAPRLAQRHRGLNKKVLPLSSGPLKVL